MRGLLEEVALGFLEVGDVERYIEFQFPGHSLPPEFAAVVHAVLTLARELNLPYAAVCLVVNKAAGRGAGPITEADMTAVMATGIDRMCAVFRAFFERY
jgi:purine nucleoside phosphorylase